MIERNSESEARLRAILLGQQVDWLNHPESNQQILHSIAKRKRELVIDELFERLDKHYKSK